MKLHLKKFTKSEPQQDEADIYNRFTIFYCTECNKRLKVPARYYGHDLDCPSCGTNTRVPDPSFSIGQRLKHYQIDGFLGEGAYGEIFISHDTHDDSQVAIKIMKPGHVSDEGIRLFKQEYALLKKFDSPHLCKSLACGREDQYFYFAMSYIQGESCDNLLRRFDQLPENLTLRILYQVADTMAMVWREQKALHNDIKPDNIVINSDGNIVVLDWGLSLFIDENAKADENKNIEIHGSPLYMCPEKLEAKPADSPISDIYSLGATIFTMLAGFPPYSAESIEEFTDIVLSGEIPRISEFVPSISQAFDQLIFDMMQIKRQDRIQSWPEIISRIEEIAGASV